MSGREVSGETTWQRTADAVMRHIADETLLVPICGDIAQLDQLFALNAVGEALWERLADPVELSELVTHVSTTFDVAPATAEIDIREFLDGLGRAGLLAAKGETGGV